MVRVVPPAVVVMVSALHLFIGVPRIAQAQYNSMRTASDVQPECAQAIKTCAAVDSCRNCLIQLQRLERPDFETRLTREATCSKVTKFLCSWVEQSVGCSAEDLTTMDLASCVASESFDCELETCTDLLPTPAPSSAPTAVPTAVGDRNGRPIDADSGASDDDETSGVASLRSWNGWSLAIGAFTAAAAVTGGGAGAVLARVAGW